MGLFYNALFSLYGSEFMSAVVIRLSVFIGIPLEYRVFVCAKMLNTFPTNWELC